MIPFSRGSASFVWEERFNVDSIDDLNDWEFYGAVYYGVTYGDSFEPNFTIAEGALVPPYAPNWSNVTWAFHDSTVTTGTWSFDLFFPSEQTYGFVIMFMLSGDYSVTPGMTEDEHLSKMTGYGLRFDTSRIKLISYMACPDDELDFSDEYPTDSPLSGSQHFNITRDTTGQFYVYHNQDYDNPIIEYQNTFASSSEKFGLCFWAGSPSLDNITVNNEVTIEPPSSTTPSGTPGFSNLIVLTSTLILVVYRSHRPKKETKN